MIVLVGSLGVQVKQQWLPQLPAIRQPTNRRQQLPEVPAGCLAVAVPHVVKQQSKPVPLAAMPVAIVLHGSWSLQPCRAPHWQSATTELVLGRLTGA